MSTNTKSTKVTNAKSETKADSKKPAPKKVVAPAKADAKKPAPKKVVAPTKAEAKSAESKGEKEKPAVYSLSAEGVNDTVLSVLDTCLGDFNENIEKAIADLKAAVFFAVLEKLKVPAEKSKLSKVTKEKTKSTKTPAKRTKASADETLTEKIKRLLNTVAALKLKATPFYNVNTGRVNGRTKANSDKFVFYRAVEDEDIRFAGEEDSKDLKKTLKFFEDEEIELEVVEDEIESTRGKAPAKKSKKDDDKDKKGKSKKDDKDKKGKDEKDKKGKSKKDDDKDKKGKDEKDKKGKSKKDEGKDNKKAKVKASAKLEKRKITQDDKGNFSDENGYVYNSLTQAIYGKYDEDKIVSLTEIDKAYLKSNNFRFIEVDDAEELKAVIRESKATEGTQVMDLEEEEEEKEEEEVLGNTLEEDKEEGKEEDKDQENEESMDDVLKSILAEAGEEEEDEKTEPVNENEAINNTEEDEEEKKALENAENDYEAEEEETKNMEREIDNQKNSEDYNSIMSFVDGLVDGVNPVQRGDTKTLATKTKLSEERVKQLMGEAEKYAQEYLNYKLKVKMQAKTLGKGVGKANTKTFANPPKPRTITKRN